MRKDRRKTRSKKERISTRPEAEPGRTISGLSPGRKWLFRLLALLLPVLVIAMLELTLRLAGYGYQTSFFKKAWIQGQDFFIQNDAFSLRFFPPEIARNPGPIRMRAQKTPGTYRIFVFGESAAMGDPEPAFGASRYMETLLRARFPQGEFEVVNVAFTAINSHVILPLARECARHQGDLWIIYMGNNEMVGPFGAATVFGAKAPPLLLVRLTILIQKFRIGQLMMDLGRKFASRSGNQKASWGGMQMFLQSQLTPDDPHKQAVYHHFRSNLEGMIRAGRDGGARILLNTVAVNLKDCPPFASVSSSNQPAADRAKLEQWTTSALHEQQQSNFAEAATQYEQAAALATKSAELQFLWAQCLLRGANISGARQHFQSACDFDALPFRADSRINSIIKETGLQKNQDLNLTLVQPEAGLAENPLMPNGDFEPHHPAILGEEVFYEHVHFNFDGNYRLGRIWAKEVEKCLPVSVTKQAGSNWLSQSDCELQMGLTDWNRSFVLESVIRRCQQPPLSGQVNNGARLEFFQQKLKELRRRMDATAAERARAEYLFALQRRPEDYYLCEAYADFLEATGKYREAEAQWRIVKKMLPQDFLAPYQLGRMLVKQERFDEAKAFFSEAVALRSTMAEAWLELGKVQATEEQFGPAVVSFDRVCRLRPQDPVALSYKGKALSKMNRHEEAMALYRQAIQLKPDYWEAHNALADELASSDRIVQAMNEYQIVIRLNPGFAMAHLNLGVMLVKQGRLGEGLQEFQEVLRLEPDNKTAREYVERVRAAQEKIGIGRTR